VKIDLQLSAQGMLNCEWRSQGQQFHHHSIFTTDTKAY